MGVFLVIVTVILATLSWRSSAVFDVTKYGAVGDGVTNDTQAFLNAWKDSCLSNVDSVILVPSGKTFMLAQADFYGPCLSYITIQILGDIVAPSTFSAWDGQDPGHWLAFRHVHGLNVNGSAVIDGRGEMWWTRSCKLQHGAEGCIKKAPTTLEFSSCRNVDLSGLHFTNGPMFHVVVYGSQSVRVSNVTIATPGHSPNTDGIHVQLSSDVTIEKSTIGTGDDCISIGTDSFNLNITGINCGPGHGISVGSLGGHESDAAVAGILVQNVNFYNTTNGARIKTWQGATGYATNITFRHLKFNTVQNPIIIDQYYCDKATASCHSPRDSAVNISDISYIDAQGNSTTGAVISLLCSEVIGCTGIRMDAVNVTLLNGATPKSKCINASGAATDVFPSISCLQSTSYGYED